MIKLVRTRSETGRSEELPTAGAVVSAAAVGFLRISITPIWHRFGGWYGRRPTTAPFAGRKTAPGLGGMVPIGIVIVIKMATATDVSRGQK